MELLAFLLWFMFLLLETLSAFGNRNCQLLNNNSTPIYVFKHWYEEKFQDTKLDNNLPAFHIMGMHSLIDYFRQMSCGNMSVEPENSIVNGTDAPEKAWPWQTLIHSGNHRCGGVLISDRWVLTAAHCFAKKAYYNVEVGIRVMGPEKGDSLFSKLAKFVIVHENFQASIWLNDIALIQLNERVVFSERVTPACLPLHRIHFNDSDVCYITGFGHGAPEVNQQRTLQQLKVAIIPLTECVYFYSMTPIPIDRRRVCAGRTLVAGACSGDSGGPLSCKEGNKYYVVGLTSFGYNKCLSGETPDVYTRVTEFLNWIFTSINKFGL